MVKAFVSRTADPGSISSTAYVPEWSLGQEEAQSAGGYGPRIKNSSIYSKFGEIPWYTEEKILFLLLGMWLSSANLSTNA